jgi:hypothetical protein
MTGQQWERSFKFYAQLAVDVPMWQDTGSTYLFAVFSDDDKSMKIVHYWVMLLGIWL